MKPLRPNDAPGYKCKPNRDGTWREGWECRSDIRKRGYSPSWVRLHYDHTAGGREQLAARCRRLQAEMLSWAAAGGEFVRPSYDGTIASLIRAFQTDPDSPYRIRMKWNTQRTFDHCAGIVSKTVGDRQVRGLVATDFNRWVRNWGAPAKDGAPPRPGRARTCIDAARTAIFWGASMGWPDCLRTATVLRNMRFKKTPARTEVMTREHVEAIRRAAHDMGLGSVALCTVLQFELMLRQGDCVGQWQPCDDPEAGGIVHRRRRWGGGLTWSDIDADQVLRKATSKTGTTVEHDLRLHPAVLEELARIPPEKRVGPLIIFERTGEPFKYASYGTVFRRVADAAGVPREVWSMDARAGAITESYGLGGKQTDIMKSAAHKTAQMSERYNRGSLEQTNRIARLRLKGADGERE